MVFSLVLVKIVDLEFWKHWWNLLKLETLQCHRMPKWYYFAISSLPWTVKNSWNSCFSCVKVLCRIHNWIHSKTSMNTNTSFIIFGHNGGISVPVARTTLPPVSCTRKILKIQHLFQYNMSVRSWNLLRSAEGRIQRTPMLHAAVRSPCRHWDDERKAEH